MFILASEQTLSLAPFRLYTSQDLSYREVTLVVLRNLLAKS